MERMKSQKLRAKKKKDTLIQNILVHSLTTLTCASLCYYAFRLPSAESFAHWKPLLADAKTLFLVANLIVAFLVGGPVLGRVAEGRRFSSPVADVYDEYVERSKRLRGTSVNVVEESCTRVEEEVVDRALEVQAGPSVGGVELEDFPMEEPEKSVSVDEVQDPEPDECGDHDEPPRKELARRAGDDMRGRRLEGGGESDELPREELTRRVEEFIDRVNKRRWLESR